MNFAFLNMLSLLNGKVQKDPGVIVGPISKFLGYILNAIFTVVNLLTESHSLGISIIFFTVIVRALMIPLAVKQQKSMGKMQELQPEIDKIKKKYGDTKDPELQKKMNTEIQTLYTKAGANPLSGCLPLFIQFPIFIALNYCMQQSFMFIDKLGGIYKGMVDLIYSAPDWIARIKPYVLDKITPGFELDIGIPENLMKVLNKFTEANWSTFFTDYADVPQILPAMSELLVQKNNIEHFFGINLLENPSFAFPAILLPILSAATSFYSSWQMSKTNKSGDSSAKTQQQVMMFAMPAMMLFFTFTMPAGVGLYWTVSTVFQIFQQMVLTKKYKAAGSNKAEKPEIIESKAIEKKPGNKKTK